MHSKPRGLPARLSKNRIKVNRAATIKEERQTVSIIKRAEQLSQEMTQTHEASIAPHVSNSVFFSFTTNASTTLLPSAEADLTSSPCDSPPSGSTL